MIDASKIKYDLVALTPQGQRYHLAEALRGLSWQELPSEMAVRLQADVENRKTQYGYIHEMLPAGGHVYLYADWGQGYSEVFRGTVFTPRYRDNPVGHLHIIAYDQLAYLMKSEDNRYYSAGTLASTIIKDIAKAWGIPLGTVDGPDVALTKQVFRGKTVASMIQTVLKAARDQNGETFFLRSAKGQIDVLKQGSNSIVYAFDGSNASNVDDQQSIENIVTRVKVYGNAKKGILQPLIATVDGDTSYGVLQKLVYQGAKGTPAEARAQAKQMLKDQGKPALRRRVNVPDLPFVRRGDEVKVEVGTITGRFYLTSIQHDAMNRTMTIGVDDSASY